MTDNQCPKCKAHLGGNLECVECGWKCAPAPLEVAMDKPEKQIDLNERAPEEAQSQDVKNGGGEAGKTQGQAKAAVQPQRHLRPAGLKGETEASPSPEPDKKRPSPSGPKSGPSPEKKATPAEEQSEDQRNPHPTTHQAGGVPSSPKDPPGSHNVNYKGDGAIIGKNVIQNIYSIFSHAERALRGAPSQAIEGDHNIQAGTYNSSTHVHLDQPSATFRGAPRSLSEVTTILDRKPTSVPDSKAFSPTEVKARKGEHLIFISSAGESVALGAAYCLIDELAIEGSERLLLDVESIPLVENSFNLQFFTQTTAQETGPMTAVVVGGFNDRARPFLDWLVKASASETGAMAVRKQLRDNRLVVLCLVDEDYIPSRFGSVRACPTFAVWDVPFLPSLLKYFFGDQSDELERRIREQQRQGKWEKADMDLYHQIRPYLDNQELPHELASRASAEPAVDGSNTPEFKGNQRIEDVLLYVATYFSDLAPHEFDRVAAALLGEKTTTVTIKSLKKNQDGEIENIETEVEKPLIDFWNADPDKYLEACQLEAVPGQNGSAIINFAVPRFREELGARLEKKHSLYLMRQFQAIHREELLFNSTPAITGNVMRLSIDMAIAHPDSFGKQWLFRLITENEAGSFSNNVHQRITQLLRQMLEKPQLEAKIDGLLKELMAVGAHDSVLYIVRGLQFAPRFDEFLWMKRLLDESDELIRYKTYYHLYSYIKKIGIYPLLDKLDAWLPADDRLPETYSISTMHALRLLVEYCSETIDRFDPRFYGSAQHLHPLLIFDDDISVRENLARLIRWLFHPGMEFVFVDLESAFGETEFDSYIIPFVCALVIEWMFLLKGRGVESTRGKLQKTPPSESGSATNATTVRDVLIEEIVKVTKPAQRNEMLAYWEELRDVMALVMSLPPDSHRIAPSDYQEQQNIRWRRELVKDLIRHFRETIRTFRVRPESKVVAHVERRAD